MENLVETSRIMVFPLRRIERMTAHNIYTQEQLGEARRKLEKMPDLTPQRITREAALENLKDTILVLAKEKGYTVSDIKAALDAMEFCFSEKAISAGSVLSPNPVLSAKFSSTDDTRLMQRVLSFTSSEAFSRCDCACKSRTVNVSSEGQADITFVNSDFVVNTSVMP
ncbi:hypothetical protein IFU33_22855 (plasmid) [Pantoea agglomerans]|uniref:hypothetical protein n=1 Tax=Enterobacter agglomerans TaxID=549 RepID=UPI0017837429|nr:hypothetical protein [Pantoea agglomerans]WLO87355.1 hypothetical protein NHB29_23160 [Pantoea agglomerans]WVJ49079.1 hypothetical protein IFU33_22855 [Pantoea agglomerans]